jgi:uncharacterized protein
MKRLQEFSIPIIGLTQHNYQFDYQLDRSFFESFEEPLITDGVFNVRVELEKRATMMIFLFSFEGKAVTECDRCLATIHLPLSDQQQLIVKYSEEEKECDDELIYVHPETASLNIAQYIYEYICLAMPLHKSYNCEEETPRPCDLKSLAFLEQANQKQDDNNEANPSIWDDLKNKLN